MHRVTVVCFLASYALALALELLYLRLPRPVLRILALVAAAAGLLAHTLYLYARQPPLVWQFSWLLFVSWILAVFYLCGAVHHRRQSWGVFVLPLVLGLVGLGVLFGPPPGDERGLWSTTEVHRLWGPVHAVLILLATVGVCIGFLASLMYLIQARRLRTKTPPGRGLKLLSLERLEAMNRRAIDLAFPLLTAGMIAGVVLMLKTDLVGWTDPRVLGTGVLWAAFVLLLYLRYGQHVRGRQVALMTIAAFVLLLCCVAISHPFRQGEYTP
jgi:ABC-type transport system involved in cytochrome c biogenesis permease subunit